MNRFFVVSENIKDGQLIIVDRAQLHHIKNVLHLKIGEDIEACDENEIEYIAKLQQIKEDTLIFKIMQIKKPDVSNLVTLTIACAIPKNVKMDDIVDKLTQLGVNRIIPLETQRVIVKLSKEKKIARLKRWEKIALSAAKQSHRSTVAAVDPVTKLTDLFKKDDNFDLKLIPTLEGERKKLKEIIGRERNILVLIGPEGDFSKDEIILAISAGCIPVSLGRTVLRVDTAAIAIASFIRFYEND